jgi:hypothetical protein
MTTPKEELKKKLREINEKLQTTLTLEDIAETLNTTIKRDTANKTITFLTMLLTYTNQNQINISFKSESSTGKSYIPLEVASYFPQEDVYEYAYSSPTSFFHDRGTWNKETKTITIDLSKKILLFLDQPHNQLLQRLRPLLSHDRKRLTYKITDKREKSGLRTKTVEIIGYPTVIFCSTKPNIDAQEKTRMLQLSAESTPTKIKESLILRANKMGNRQQYRETLQQNQKRNNMIKRIQRIKEHRIDEILILNSLQVAQRFIETRPHLQPRHTRDIGRLFALIKAHALLNLWNRNEIIENGRKIITANQEDIDAGFKLYNEIAKPNEYGVAPETLQIYETIFLPHADTGMIKTQIFHEYRKTYGRPLSSKRLEKNIIPALKASGLINDIPDPEDKRFRRYIPLENYILPKGGVNNTSTIRYLSINHDIQHSSIIEYSTPPLRGIYLQSEEEC